MISGKRVLLTGGAGFIGTALVRKLCESNECVVFDLLRRNALGPAGLDKHPNVTLIPGDVRDAAALGKAMDGCTHVAHLASIAGVDTVLKNPVPTMEIALEGTMTALRCARERLPLVERFIDFSTSEVFGRYAFRVGEGDVTTLGAVGEARWTYAVSKLATEHLAHCYHKQFGLPTVSIRPFNIFGPGQVGEGAIHAFVLRAIKNEPITIHNAGDQIRSWCFIDDIVDSVLLTLERDEAVGHAFNIGNTRATVTIYQLARMVVSLAKSTSEIRFVDWPFADVELRIPDTSKAKELLGFQAKVELEDGIERTIAWYREKLAREAQGRPMSAQRYALDGVRADGWFDRVLKGVPALGRLCAGVGEALVALSLVAGYRVISASVDRNTNAVGDLQWVRDVPGEAEVKGSGTPDQLRDAVIATLMEDEASTTVRGRIDDDALRTIVGMRTILLAPLFGIDMKAALLAEGSTMLALGADDGEVEVPLDEVRRFLRARVVEVLRSGRPRAVTLDLAQLDAVREAGAEGRDEEVVSVMAPQFGVLVTYLRTPDGASMGPEGRAVVARALVALGRSLVRIGRAEECGDALRLAAQYAHDGPAAAEVYVALGEALAAQGRFAEAIGPLRRAMALDVALRATVLPSLARCYLETGRAVAAAAVIEEMRERGGDVTTLEPRAATALGEAWQGWRSLRGGRRPVVVPVDGTSVSAEG